ncbi:MAG TPA: DUF2959 family protein, partial [Myxococcota bacterium]|nr:DUF2959 family protein [Myxococcota bacterium]
LAPEFRGDPVEGHKALVAAVEQSEEQAEALQGSVRPMRKTADSVFARWTADLESFGNISLRTRSQERLEETRKRYDAILATAVSAQLAYNSYNSDLKDNALFLEHDFNATAVQSIAGELDGLRARGKELARRLDACAAACQAYVEFSAPSAQVAPEDAPSDPQDAAPAGPKKPGTKTTTKLPPKSTRTPASGPEGG